MNKKKLITGISSGIQLVSCIAGDLIPIPGVGTIIDAGTEKIISVISEKYLDRLCLENIFNRKVGQTLKIEDFDVTYSCINDAFASNGILDIDQVDLNNELFEKYEYKIDVIAQKMLVSQELANKEYYDVYKALQYVLFVIIINLSKKEDFLVDILKNVSSMSHKISKLELQMQKVLEISIPTCPTGIQSWMSCLNRYQQEGIYKRYFSSETIKSDLIPKILINNKEYDLSEYVLEQKEAIKIYATGQGGTGKTFTLLYLWKELLDRNIPCIYIPICRLNIKKYGTNALDEWINRNILVYDNYHKDTHDKLNRFISDIIEASEVPFFLLMDGINEVSDSNCVFRMIEQWGTYSGVSTVITSRNEDFLKFDDESIYVPGEFKLLSHEVVNDYTEALSIVNISASVRQLLRKPQMLTLFVGISSVYQKYRLVSGFEWKDINCEADIIHNYLESIIAELAFEKEFLTHWQARVLVRYILPEISWHIFSNNEFSMKKLYLNQLLRRITDYLNNDNIQLPQTLMASYSIEDMLSIRKIDYIICNNLSVIELFADDNLVISHQSYYEYLISRHWINIAQNIDFMMGITNNSWADTIIPVTVMNYLSNSTSCRFPSDYEIIDNFWNCQKGNRIDAKNLTVDNLCKIYKHINNWDLSRIDFSEMDLRHTSLSGTVLSTESASACFSGADISETTFAPLGHHAAILQTFFLRDNDHRLYSIDLHRKMSVFDINTYRRIEFYDEIPFNPRGEIDKLMSSADKFVVLRKNKDWLGEIFTGVETIDVKTGKKEFINNPDFSPFSPTPLYIASSDHWVIIKGKNMHCISSNEKCNDTNIVLKFQKDTRSRSFLLSEKSQVAFVRSIYEISEDVFKEEINRIDLCDMTVGLVFSGPVLVGRNVHTLSEDGTLLVLEDDTGAINLINTDSWTIVGKLLDASSAERHYRQKLYISSDNQWCVSISPTKEMYPWKVKIWNIYLSAFSAEYEVNEIISSLCFSPKNNKVILGLFDGSLEEIDLNSKQRHRIAVGYRVDQSLCSNAEGLLVKRSDGFWQKWDIKNKVALSQQKHFNKIALRDYTLCCNGIMWYRCLNKKLYFHNIDSMLDISLPLRVDCISNEEQEFLLAFDVSHIDIDGNIKCFYISTKDGTSIKTATFQLNEYKNKYYSIKKAHVTENLKYCLLIAKTAQGEYERHLDLAKTEIILIDLEKELITKIFHIDQEYELVDETYQIDSCDNSAIICFIKTRTILRFDLANGDFSEYKYSYARCTLKTSMELESIEAVHVGRPEPVEEKPPLNGAIIISPDGKIYSNQPQLHLKKDLEDEVCNLPEDAMLISPGEVMCCKMVSVDEVLIGYTSGILAHIYLSKNELPVYCYCESNYRLYNISLLNDNGERYIIAVQKDDRLNIWKYPSMEYQGWVMSLPGTNIFNCNFSFAKFENESVKELIRMNGGKIS